MKALICEQFGTIESLKLKDVAIPKPAADELLIKIKACSLNFPDLLIVQGKYQLKPELPFSPGGEIAGEVVDMGSEVKKFKKGDSVFSHCKWGGMAEYAVVKADAAFPMLAGSSYVKAASFSYNFGTAYHALKNRGGLKTNETLLVLGAAGGVGLAAVQLGKAMGAKIIAAASSADRLELCKQNGADFLINYNEENLKESVKKLTNGTGVNMVFDPVGGELSDAALRATAAEGRYLVVGFASGHVPQIGLNIPLLKSCSIVGVFFSRFVKEQPEEAYKNLQELGMFYLAGQLKPHIDKVYALADSKEALQDLSQRKIKGKAVVIPVAEEEAFEIPIKQEDFAQPENPSENITIFNEKREVAGHIGKNLGSSDWLKVTQETIQKFADATFDHQWIHLDELKAKDTVFGGTIAHGYLTLSLIPKLMETVYRAPFAKIGINYGSEKVRFMHPVASGSEIRVTAKLKHASEINNGGVKMIVECTIEIKGANKPACYAELITVLY
ncbi:zinc-binding dehydrogenase [Jiulongibacter sp. NS-SX5]|uniref:zinc-binding dehydrogenase n=1 Tax=Jiulongibacter sp. NS-SX5 TaxID=3463854 RepID=UPI00405960CB